VKCTEAYARPKMKNTSLDKKRATKAKEDAKALKKKKKVDAKAEKIAKDQLQKTKKDAILKKKNEQAKQKAEIEKWKRHSIEDRKVLVSYIDDLKKEIEKLKKRN
jgi:hypothetical protein